MFTVYKYVCFRFNNYKRSLFICKRSMEFFNFTFGVYVHIFKIIAAIIFIYINGYTISYNS